MEKVKLSVERCKGCYFCIEVCKKDVISFFDYINKKGFVIIKVDEEKCI